MLYSVAGRNAKRQKRRFWQHYFRIVCVSNESLSDIVEERLTWHPCDLKLRGKSKRPSVHIISTRVTAFSLQYCKGYHKILVPGLFSSFYVTKKKL